MFFSQALMISYAFAVINHTRVKMLAFQKRATDESKNGELDEALAVWQCVCNFHALKLMSAGSAQNLKCKLSFCRSYDMWEIDFFKQLFRAMRLFNIWSVFWIQYFPFCKWCQKHKMTQNTYLFLQSSVTQGTRIIRIDKEYVEDILQPKSNEPNSRDYFLFWNNLSHALQRNHKF